jgi:hypothetical protein
VVGRSNLTGRFLSGIRPFLLYIIDKELIFCGVKQPLFCGGQRNVFSGVKKPFFCEIKDLFSVGHKSLFRGPKFLSFLVKTVKNGGASLFSPDLFSPFHIRKNVDSKFFYWEFFQTFV